MRGTQIEGTEHTHPYPYIAFYGPKLEKRTTNYSNKLSKRAVHFWCAALEIHKSSQILFSVPFLLFIIVRLGKVIAQNCNQLIDMLPSDKGFYSISYKHR